VRVADPGLVVTDDDHASLLADALARADADVPIVVPAREGTDTLPQAPRAELALLQFTSGSSASPKGVRVTWSNLEDAVGGLVDHLCAHPDGHMATWLPLHHDMGLVGCLLTSATAQQELSCLRPDQFVRRPARWLACAQHERPTVTVSSAFAFGYAASRVREEDAAALDLSGWHLAGLGAERVGADVLDRFARRFADRGFRPEAFGPGYGMAELTLAATGSEHGVAPGAVRIEPGTLRLGEAVPGKPRPLPELSGAPDVAEWLVSSGRPICGCQVRIAGDDGAELPEGHLGEIVVSGPVVADGYRGDATGQLTRFTGGELHTGDAGFLRDGELYVLGRMGDAINARGRVVYLEDLEASLGGVDGLVGGRFAVLAGPDAVVALVEQDAGSWTRAAHAALVRHVGADVAVRIRTADRGTILRTTSGKPQRRRMWQELLDGRLPGRDAEPAGHGACAG
jgi:acyl-CoA synthetase (AMP-forming)/AMP-acid ligase II